MPIYEFYCQDCHRLFRFLSRRVNTRKRPGCPRCGRPRIERRPSTFAVSRADSAAESRADSPSAAEQARLESAMESLAAEVGAADEDDPRQGARLLRRLYDRAGLRPGPGMDEALRRLEAGEDPERIEERLGDVLEEDPLGSEDERMAGSRRRRLPVPPSVDPELHEF